jgi:D-glycero-D-manno-heptose 1,7-bisphosphate phosphatase
MITPPLSISAKPALTVNVASSCIATTKSRWRGGPGRPRRYARKIHTTHPIETTRGRAAFLDRDGTLNVKAPEHDYVTSLAGFAWLPGAVEGAATLAEAGFLLAVVSNQRGVARGLVSPKTLVEIEDEIQAALAPHGAAIAAFRYCPHELDEGCDCRKPAPGMILELAADLDLDLASSWMIGDSASDVAAGRAAGCHTALLAPAATSTDADLVADSLLEVARALSA